MKKLLRHTLLAAMIAIMLTMAAAAGDWKPIQIEPVAGYYLVNEKEPYWEASYAYEFNEDGNITKKTTTYPGSESTTVETYSYDENGNITQETTESTYNEFKHTIVKTYSYDENGDCVKIITVSSSDNGSEVTENTAEARFTYDSNHNLIRYEDDYGYTTYSYNSLGQLVEESTFKGDYYEKTVAYTYTSDGNLLSVTSASVEKREYGGIMGHPVTVDTDTETSTTDYVYDSNGRCTSEQTSIVTVSVRGESLFVPASESTNTETSTTNYEYDTDGNCTSERTIIKGHYGSTGNTYIQGSGKDYFYNDQGRLSKYIEVWLDEDDTTYNEGSTLIYEYDAVGNNTKITIIRTYEGEDSTPITEISEYIYEYEYLGPEPEPEPEPEPDPVPDPQPPINPFVDVKSGDYYYDAVMWAVANNITAGTSATTFSPDKTCTRAQVVTFLWRAAGEPEPTSTVNPFTDVKSGAYYYKAVLWAVENGITAGTSKTKFSPEQGCTRAQVATFLYRAAGEPKPTSGSNPFTDVKSSAYYYNAVQWAVENGITKGTSSTKYSPNVSCTRAQIVTFLYRAYA